ncbi:MAG: hypothetical protein PVF58_14415 [Candidatus Methanofastidiosia archaeon]|jgi:hypothetical protein
MNKIMVEKEMMGMEMMRMEMMEILHQILQPHPVTIMVHLLQFNQKERELSCCTVIYKRSYFNIFPIRTKKNGDDHHE